MASWAPRIWRCCSVHGRAKDFLELQPHPCAGAGEVDNKAIAKEANNARVMHGGAGDLARGMGKASRAVTTRDFLAFVRDDRRVEAPNSLAPTAPSPSRSAAHGRAQFTAILTQRRGARG